ncbi:unnamed protein product [Notodromas monacha]|uniref:Conserved oligomeric Golgi complex subunit 1 n=1 Tax=Notodromas monacha TaxID=399045 RepID=A0A7R9BXG3_9CRUS|nr:unnamed protein product [Notodromas monacha]CAG0923583.1 unnamed protein product [Notodromas monacha]
MKRLAYYSLAGQICILMDAPEAIWSAVESKDNLLAAELYLLARQVYHGLKFNTSSGTMSLSCEKIMQWFPVISRQWGAISHFKDVILQACRIRLEDLYLTPKIAAEDLLAVLLLKNVNVEYMLELFLEFRSEVLQRLVNLDKTKTSSKEQICLLMQLFSNTFTIVYSCFISAADHAGTDAETGLLPRWAAASFRADNNECRRPLLSYLNIHNSPADKYLPDKIKTYRPNPSSSVESLEKRLVCSKCSSWSSKGRASVSTSIPKWLDYVDSAKNLSTIRQAVSAVLAADEYSRDWDKILAVLLEEEVRFKRWEDLFLPHFTARAFKIIDSQISALSRGLVADVTEFLRSIEKEKIAETDLSPYIWSESGSDIPEVDGWISPVRMGRIGLDSGELPMKTLGLSEGVLKACRLMDAEAGRILEDIGNYVDPERSNSSFDQSADKDEIFEKLATSIVSEMTASVEQIVSDVKQDLQNHVGDFQKMIAKLVFVARLCHAIPQLCSNFRSCVDSLNNSTVSAEFLMIWERAETWAYSQWTKEIANEFQRQLTAHFPVISVDLIFSTIPVWDAILVDEENAEGLPIKSQIKLPSGPSYFLLDAILFAAETVNAAGAHAIAPEVKVTLAENLMRVVLDHYCHRITSPIVTQAIALQLIFDIHFANNVLVAPKNQDLNRDVSKTCGNLEEFVDPFDLEVSMPNLMSNLKKYTSRSEAYLSVLTVKEKVNPGTAEPKLTGDNPNSSALALNVGHSRFPLLPLAVQKPHAPLIADEFDFGNTDLHPSTAHRGGVRGGKMKATSIEESNGTGSKPPGDPMFKTDMKGSKSSAAFFFEAIGTNWFGSGSN